jgi:hypothetical protein
MSGPLIAFAALLASPSPTAPLKLPPVDQCRTDPGLPAFRAKLANAANKRDAEALLAMVSPDVLIDFGGGAGKQVFIEQWRPREVESALWPLLDRILPLGCARSGKARVIPSLIEQLDPFEDEVERILILPGALLYKGAGEKSPRPKTEPWTLATVTSRVADWGTGVRLPDGRQGYVPDDDVYEPLGYRMVIDKRAGKWLITAFVAGD